jgi:glucose-6-phosphate isomerase
MDLLLDEINKLREELHGLIAGNPELKRQQVIECSERLDKLIYAYLQQVQEESNLSDSAE